MADAISAKTAWALAKAIKGGSKKKLPNSGTATVVRVDQDGTHWVRISGSDVETPVNGAITADARPGDTVQYHLEDTRISITGNATSPSVGKEYVGERVEPVEAKVDVVAKANALLNTATERARSVADAAKSVADAVNQHFFSDDGGVHVTEATQEDWDTNHSGANVLINSIGQLFRDGLNNLLTLTTEDGARALTVWDGLGNAASNVRAIIGETIQLGNAATGAVLTLDSDSLDMESGGTNVMHVGITEQTSNGTTTIVPNYSMGKRASGSTIGDYSMAEGEDVTASGRAAHAEGQQTEASGDASHAQGIGTIAASAAQTAIGKYNDNDPNNAFEVGNGSGDNARSNAYAVDWSGNVECAGIDNSGPVNVYGSFTVSTVTILDGSTSIPAGNAVSGTLSITNQGDYRPLAIVGWNSNSSYSLMSRIYLSPTSTGGTIAYNVYNAYSSARTPTVSAVVLWARA